MMKNSLIIAIALFFTHLHCLSQHTFEFVYSTPFDDVVSESAVDHYGNVILVGRTAHVTAEGVQTMKAIILKVYPDGNYQSKLFDKQDTVSIFPSITILDNGNYFVTGRYSADGDVFTLDHLWIVIMDSDLEVVSEKLYMAPEGYLGYWSNTNTIIDEDGHIALVTEVARQYTHYQVADFIMYKFNQEGDTLLSRLYPSWNSSALRSLCPMPGTDSLMMLGRGLLLNGAESMDFMDKDMNISHGIELSAVNGSERQGNNIWLSASEFLMAANRIVDFEGKREYFFSVFRVNTSGEYLHELPLDRPDTLEYRAYRQAMVRANDSTIYVTGHQSYNLGWTTIPSTSVIYLIDIDMNLIGRKSFGGDANYTLWGVAATPDDGALVYGTRYVQAGSYARDIHVWKFLREDFEIITKVEHLPEALPPAKAWPNPARSEVNISLSAFAQGQNVRFRIYDAQGHKYVDKQIHVSGNSLRAGISPLPPGLYVYEMVGSDGMKQGGKFLKE
jgi:hypothetical protein